jgi:hypothetical protein
MLAHDDPELTAALAEVAGDWESPVGANRPRLEDESSESPVEVDRPKLEVDYLSLSSTSKMTTWQFGTLM